jgi:hypothetical protein
VNPIAPSWIVPFYGALVTDDQAGTALETWLIGKLYPLPFLIPLIATSRTSERAGLVKASLASILIDEDMRL